MASQSLLCKIQQPKRNMEHGTAVQMALAGPGGGGGVGKVGIPQNIRKWHIIDIFLGIS